MNHPKLNKKKIHHYHLKYFINKLTSTSHSLLGINFINGNNLMDDLLTIDAQIIVEIVRPIKNMIETQKYKLACQNGRSLLKTVVRVHVC